MGYVTHLLLNPTPTIAMVTKNNSFCQPTALFSSHFQSVFAMCICGLRPQNPRLLKKLNVVSSLLMDPPLISTRHLQNWLSNRGVTGLNCTVSGGKAGKRFLLKAALVEISQSSDRFNHPESDTQRCCIGIWNFHQFSDLCDHKQSRLCSL